jgi:putative DNA primase/helicase
VDYLPDGMNFEQEQLYEEWKKGLIPEDELREIDLDIFGSEGLKCLVLTDKGRDLSHILRHVLIKYGVIEFTEKKDGEREFKRINCQAFGKMILSEYDYNFVTMRDTKEIYYYKMGVYKKYGESIIKNLAVKWLDTQTSNYKKNEIVGYLQDKKYVNRDEFEADPRFINLANGIYDVVEKKLIQHTPHLFFLNQIQINFDNNARCPNFKKFLRNICKHNSKRRPLIEKTIQEYIGYSLYRSYPLKYFIVLDGNGDNGKTTLLDIVIDLIGKKNNTGVSLHDLNTRDFALSKLYGKLTNISDDLSNKALKYSGKIKQITGNSSVWGDIKNHKDGIDFINYAKPWYACNQLPESKDWSDAFFSRMIQITLLNKFVKPQDYDLIDKKTVFKADVNIREKILSELPGILNFAIKGLQRLLKNNGFSYKQKTDDIREEYLKKTNPIHSFIEDECEFTNSDWGITKKDFYKAVIDYCIRNGFDKPSSQHIVTKKLNDEGRNIYKKQKTINGSVEWCWIGIKSANDSTINQYFGKQEQGLII